MHEIMRSLDIFCELRSFLSNRELCSMARTCRLFKEFAEPEIWRKIPGLYPLFMSLPEDLWILVAEKLITDPDVRVDCWERLLAKARHVREVEVLFETGLSHLRPTMYAKLAEVVSVRGPLLPNLQKFHLDSCFQEIRYDFPFLDVFLGPNIENFICAPGVLHPEFIYCLIGKLPSLRVVDIKASIFVDANKMARPLSSAVMNWGQLRSLTISNLEPEAYKFIAMLPTLRTFSFLLTTKGERFPISFPDSSSTFQALEEFHLDCNSVGACLDVLNTLSILSPIKEIGLEIFPTAAPTEWMSVFRTLNKKCNHNTLRSIMVVDNYENRDPKEATAPLAMNVLQVLSDFKNLENVELAPWGLFDLTDQDIENLARNWPHLCHLRLGKLRSPNFDFQLRTTLQSIMSLARHCPDLHELCINMDATIIPSPPCSPSADYDLLSTWAGLSSLSVMTSPIEEPSKVAQFLSKFCKKSCKIEPSFGSDDRWLTVQDLLDEIQRECLRVD